MSCGFEAIVYEMPSHSAPVEDLVREAGYDKEMVARLHSGQLRSVPVEYNRPLPYLVNRAIIQLSENIEGFGSRAHGVLFAHSVPLLAPADVPFLSLCLENTGLENIPRIAIGGQPCAILHMAVQLACKWLMTTPENAGILIIGADQAYSAEERIFFGSAMGDVAVAGFVSRQSTANEIIATISECEIIAFGGEESPEADITRFRQLNPLFIRHAIESCLRAGNLTLKDVSIIVPHTPYTMIWDTIAELIGYPRDQILTKYLSQTGHLNSNDSFVHYVHAINDGLISKGDIALLVNPGFGGTRGCTLIRH